MPGGEDHWGNLGAGHHRLHERSATLGGPGGTGPGKDESYRLSRGKRAPGSMRVPGAALGWVDEHDDNLFPHGSGGQRFKISEENPLHASPWLLRDTLGTRAELHLSTLGLCLHLVASNPPILSLIRTPVAGFKASPKSRMISSREP